MTGGNNYPSMYPSTTTRGCLRKEWNWCVRPTSAITPRPIQRLIPAYVASFSRPFIELAAKLGCGLIGAPFAAAMSFGGLEQVAQLL
jgi:alkanesulfonate monooxygenase SsuD/methylene tetrahydromethanopterin reductase-like flavin-dependent oxidoreductase (luciferase family)